MTDRPDCPCHGEPMYAAGKEGWRCAVKRRANQHTYGRTAKGRAAQQRYDHSEKGRVRRQLYALGRIHLDTRIR